MGLFDELFCGFVEANHVEPLWITRFARHSA